jgi:chromosome segregation ATPase
MAADVAQLNRSSAVAEAIAKSNEAELVKMLAESRARRADRGGPRPRAAKAAAVESLEAQVADLQAREQECLDSRELEGELLDDLVRDKAALLEHVGVLESRLDEMQKRLDASSANEWDLTKRLSKGADYVEEAHGMLNHSEAMHRATKERLGVQERRAAKFKRERDEANRHLADGSYVPEEARPFMAGY